MISKILFLCFPNTFFLDKLEVYAFMVFCCSLGLVLMLGTQVIKWLKRHKYCDNPNKDFCEKLELLHSSKKDTPTMGGILIWGCVSLSLLLWSHSFNYKTLFLLLVLFSWGLIGLHDDKLKNKNQKGHGLSAKHKFLLQLLISTVTVLAPFSPISYERLINSHKTMEIKIPFKHSEIRVRKFPLKLLIVSLAIIAIVGTANAVNITDGLDGLAIGCSIIVTAFLLWTSIVLGAGRDIICILAALLGSGVGFLRFNAFPAQLFMGDTGSLFLGGIIGSVAVFLRMEIFLIFSGGIFVVEALSVILQVVSYRTRKKRIFLCAPLHHHYEYKGISEQQVVLRFWFIGVILLGLSLLSFIC